MTRDISPVTVGPRLLVYAKKPAHFTVNLWKQLLEAVPISVTLAHES